MDVLDLEARVRELRGQAATYRGAADTARRLADLYYRGGCDLREEAVEKDAEADRLVRQLVLLGAVDAANEEKFRAAAAVPAEEEQ